MSSNLYRAAYATRLGNLTAKSVLVKLCDEANSEGIAWPSFETIAMDTEISLRAVQRLVSVFEALGMIAWFPPTMMSDRFGEREVEPYRINVAMLGGDLTEEFAKAHAASQGKEVEKVGAKWRLRDAGKRLRDANVDVSETQVGVSETQVGVSETFPPYPLIGRPTTDPSLDPPPDPLAKNLVCENTEPVRQSELAGEQQKHIDELTNAGRLVDAKMWADFYRAEERKKIADDALRKVEAEKDAELQALYGGDLDAAILRMRKQCGFAWAEGDLLGPVIRRALLDRMEQGELQWRVLERMRARWKLQRDGKLFRAQYGPMTFFRDGHWLAGDE